MHFIFIGMVSSPDDVLHEVPLDLSPRALQYRFQRATALLEQGCPILDTAYSSAISYFDPSHLTNSLRRFIRQTPAQISQALQPEALRFFPRLRPLIVVS